MKKVTKAIIPAAGFGTRFLPQTKAMPKEMLPVVDKPVIQYVVEELVDAGIKDIIIVTGWNKRAIEDHFDTNFELDMLLQESGKMELLEEVRRITNLANFYYVRQKGPKGNATPILNAKPIIGDEPFLVLWGDDFITAEPSRTKQLITAYEEYGGSILGAIRTKRPEDTMRYGFAGGEELKKGVIKVKSLIEKPGPKNAPSDLAVVSGFIFTPEIFSCIEEVKQSLEAGKELVYIDALNLLMKKQYVYAVEVKGAKYYDTGNKLEYLKTVVEFALKHTDLNGEFRDYIKKLRV